MQSDLFFAILTLIFLQAQNAFRIGITTMVVGISQSTDSSGLFLISKILRIFDLTNFYAENY